MPGTADERVGQRGVAAFLDGLAVDHRDAGGDVDHRRRDARGGDDDFAGWRSVVGEGGGERTVQVPPPCNRSSLRAQREQISIESAARLIGRLLRCARNDIGGRGRDIESEPAHAGPPSTKVDSPPAGSPPPHRYTPPEARAQSRRRPVSWLAGRCLVPPSRLATMARGTRLAAHSCGGSSLALGHDPRVRLSRFSPCGPPTSGTTVAQSKRARNDPSHRIRTERRRPARRHPRGRSVAPGGGQHGEPAACRSGCGGDQDRGPAHRRSVARLAREGVVAALEGVCAQQEEPGDQPAAAGRARRAAAICWRRAMC